MNSEEFVSLFKQEKENLKKTFLDIDSGSLTAELIGEIDLPEEKKERIIDSILTDTFYTILLGLDGSASIGDVQEQFQIHDEKGNLITNGGDIEGHAFEQFQS
jgi:hypothetical protein